MMFFVRPAHVVSAITGFVTSGVIAQTTSPTTEPSPSISSKIDDISNWTSERWNRAKSEWAKEKEKWTGCQKQAEEKNLAGRESWSFLASCMKS